MKLDVIIPTHGEQGIRRVSDMILPEVKDVSYIIGWQNYSDIPIPENLKRKDIRVILNERTGLSQNRNHCIAASQADIVYCADDDVTFLEGSLEKVLRSFKEYPDTDVGTYMSLTLDHSAYPTEITKLKRKLPKGYSVKSIEIAFKRTLYPHIKFDERFGLNSGKYNIGEDEVFLLKALQNHLCCRFFPIPVVSHMHESTGSKKITDKSILKGMGVIIMKSYPHTGIFRIPLKTWRLYRNKQTSLLKGFANLSIGACQSLFLRI